MNRITVPTLLIGVESRVACSLPPWTGIEVVRTWDRSVFISALSGGLGYIASRGLSKDLMREIVAFRKACPGIRLIVGLADPQSAIVRRGLDDHRMLEVSPLPSPDLLCLQIHKAWFECRVEEIVRLFEARDVHGILKSAVRRILGQRLKPELKKHVPVKSISALSSRCGVGRKYLSALARDADVHLPSVLFTWVLVLACRERFLIHETWERVAWRCGYYQISGLSELSQRRLGKGLKEVGPDWYWEGLSLVHEMLSGTGGIHPGPNL